MEGEKYKHNECHVAYFQRRRKEGFRLGWVSFIYIFGSIFLNGICKAQPFFDNRGHVSCDIGLMFNTPKKSSPSHEIVGLPSSDFNINFNYFTFKNNWGWSYSAGFCTQAIRFKRKLIDGTYQTSQTWTGFSGRYHLSIKKTYNFNASKNTNFLIYLGPSLLLNRLTGNVDSLRNSPNSNTVSYNTKPLGAAIELGLYYCIKGTTKSKFYFHTSFQLGLFNIKEARILTSTLASEKTLFYNGSGVNTSIGLLFFSRRTPIKTNSPSVVNRPLKSL